MRPSELNFEDYSDKCAQELMPLQEEFMQLYNINSYEHWFYDHDIGAFHFRADSGKNLYFKYVDVGSFSTKTNTWKWSWDNESTPAHVCRKLEKVKEFGRRNNYTELTEGLIDGDEYTGWAMTAISFKLLSAFGAYSVPHDHLFIYFIFTNEISGEEYESLKDKYVACDRHYSGRTAFVCQHLINTDNLGFHEAFESDPSIEEEDDYQGWCDECEKVRVNAGEWTDEATVFANIQVVCDQCYFDIKRRNQM